VSFSEPIKANLREPKGSPERFSSEAKSEGTEDWKTNQTEFLSEVPARMREPNEAERKR